MKYIYTAVFKKDGDRIFASVPDIPGCVTSGRDLNDAILMITDAASGCLVVAEDEGLTIAPATPQNEFAHEDGSVFSLIQIDTIAYRAATETKSVRKNVSLPAWMARLADKRGINCSQLLQEALLRKYDADQNASAL